MHWPLLLSVMFFCCSYEEQNYLAINQNMDSMYFLTKSEADVILMMSAAVSYLYAFV